MKRGSMSSELPMCGGGVHSILSLHLVARCLEIIDLCIWCMFVMIAKHWRRHYSHTSQTTSHTSPCNIVSKATNLQVQHYTTCCWPHPTTEKWWRVPQPFLRTPTDGIPPSSQARWSTGRPSPVNQQVPHIHGGRPQIRDL